MTKKLTATMIAAIVEIQDHGSEVVRWVGGYWTYQGCPPARGAGAVPEWYVGTQTVEALVNRGFLEVTERKGNGGNELPIRMRVVASAVT